MNAYTPGDRLTLTDPDGTPLGAVEVDTVEGARVLGTFRPGPGFARVAELFRRFEEMVEAAALAVLPGIEAEIEGLGLRVARPGEPGVPVGDVQIYSDGGFSCRVMQPVVLNGRSATSPGALARD